MMEDMSEKEYQAALILLGQLVNEPPKKLVAKMKTIQARNIRWAVIDENAIGLICDLGYPKNLVICLTGVCNDEATDELVIGLLPKDFNPKKGFVEHNQCRAIKPDQVIEAAKQAFVQKLAKARTKMLCPTCKGKGKVPADPAHAPDGATCSKCRGSGCVRRTKSSAAQALS